MAAIMNVESPDRRTQNLRDRLNPQNMVIIFVF